MKPLLLPPLGGEPPRRFVVDSTWEAIRHYQSGCGESVELGPKTISAVLENEKFRSKHMKIVFGQTSSPSGCFSVRMSQPFATVFHVGNTNINYEVRCVGDQCIVDYLLFVGDGFWDPNEVFERALGDLGGPFAPDGPGPNLEMLNGSPYNYIPKRVSIPFNNPDSESVRPKNTGPQCVTPSQAPSLVGEPRGFVVDSTWDAIAHYQLGRGESADLGPRTISAVLENDKFWSKHSNIVSGQTSSLAGCFSVQMSQPFATVFHVGNTNINYEVRCVGDQCIVDYLLFVGDGFWDPNEVFERALGDLGGPFAPDGPGPNLEMLNGTPYNYNPKKVSIPFNNPGYTNDGAAPLMIRPNPADAPSRDAASIGPASAFREVGPRRIAPPQKTNGF